MAARGRFTVESVLASRRGDCAATDELPGGERPHRRAASRLVGAGVSGDGLLGGDVTVGHASRHRDVADSGDSRRELGRHPAFSRLRVCELLHLDLSSQSRCALAGGVGDGVQPDMGGRSRLHSGGELDRTLSGGEGDLSSERGSNAQLEWALLA